MSYSRHILGLPPLAINFISGGGAFCLACLGISFVRSPNFALKVANHQLVTSNCVDKLEHLVDDLETQATIIEQKDLAYEKLSQIYRDNLDGKETDEELLDAIEAVAQLPKIKEIEELQTELSITGEILKETVTNGLEVEIPLK